MSIFIPNCLVDRIKRVHFTIIDLNREIEYNIVKCPIVGLIRGDSIEVKICFGKKILRL